MKTNVLFLLTPLAVLAVPVLEPRQLGGLMSAGATALLTEAKPAKTETGAPSIKRPGVKRIKIYYGPFTLLGANTPRAWSPMRMDPKGNTWTNIAAGLPADVTVLSSNTTLQYEDGTMADISSGVYNHHVMFGDISRSSVIPLVCASASTAKGSTKSKADGPGGMSSMPMSILMGTSADTGTTGATSFSTPDGMFNSGYYLGTKNKIIMTGEVVNYSNVTKKIYAVSDMEYLPGKPAGLLDPTIMIASVTQCDGGNPALKPPAGQSKFEFSSKDMVVTGDGWILTRRGHLHDGGVAVDFKLNGKSICTSNAVYGTNGQTMTTADGGKWQTVSEMSECNDPVKVKKGDRVTINANYDLELHPARKHVGGGMAEEMGLMSFLFASDPEGKGGAAPPF